MKKKISGGERNDLMKVQKNNKSTVPLSIQLLFNNEKLELMKVLCLMNAFSNQSNKQRKVEELLFYYGLVNFNLIYLIDSKNDKEHDFTPSPNQYFRFQIKIKNILLVMSHLQFIGINGEISKKIEESKVKLLPLGKKFFENNKTEYLDDLYNKYIEMSETISYSSVNIKKIKEGQY